MEGSSLHPNQQGPDKGQSVKLQFDLAGAAFPNLVCLAVSLLRNRGIGAGPQSEIPDELFDALGLSREKAEDAVSKVLSAEVALRELAAQYQQPQ